MKDYTGKYERTLKRLESQLAAGVKPEKINGKTTKNKIPLNPKDIKRIAYEMRAIDFLIQGGSKSAWKRQKNGIN